MKRPTPADVEKLLMMHGNDSEEVVRQLVEDDGLSENQARALIRGTIAAETDGSSALAPVVNITGRRAGDPLAPIKEAIKDAENADSVPGVAAAAVEAMAVTGMDTATAATVRAYLKREKLLPLAEFDRIVAEARRARTRSSGGRPASVPDEQDADDREQFPPPGNPMAVARCLLPSWLHDGIPTLRHWRGMWMRWARTHWVEVDDREIRTILYRRLEHGGYEDAEGEVRPWAPSKRKIADLAEATASIAHLSARIDPPSEIETRWDATIDDFRAHGRSETIVSCLNGLLRVSDRELSDLTPAFFNLVSVPFGYDPDATAPTWLKFLGQVWPDDPASIAALQEWFGYVISGRTDLQKILLIVGPTRSGKGTIARVLTALVGKGNMAGPTLASLASQFGLQPLLGKPLAVISDARLAGNGHAVVERLLTISGEDAIDVDRKHKEAWTGKLPTRITILSNELPHFGDASGAIAHRFIVLTMVKSWLGKENTQLTVELAKELPGILNWALDGLARLEKRGYFAEPQSSADAVVAMQDMASPTSAFVREWCDLGTGREVSVDTLYAAWKSWCEHSGISRTSSKQQFGKDLRAAAPGVRRMRPRDETGRQAHPLYGGISLKPESERGQETYVSGDPETRPAMETPRLSATQPVLDAAETR